MKTMDLFELEIPDVLDEAVLQNELNKLIHKIISKSQFESWLELTLQSAVITNSACLNSVIQSLLKKDVIYSQDDLHEMYFCLKHHIVYSE